jgi:hypothetical protein
MEVGEVISSVVPALRRDPDAAAYRSRTLFDDFP